MFKFNFKLNNKGINHGLTTLFLIIVGLSSIGIVQLQKIRIDFSLVNESIEKQGDEIEEMDKQIRQLLKVNENGISRLEAELILEREKRLSVEASQVRDKLLAQEQISSLEEKIAETGKNELTTIIDRWEPYVVALECNFYLPGTSNLFLQSSGSGFLTNWDYDSVVVLTNKHVITAMALNRDDIANNCVLRFPQRDVMLFSENVAVLDGGYDWGIVRINTSNSYIQSLIQDSPKLCTKNPDLGDELAILGYPSIGDQKNVTVTEGIIAGFDNDYFITSAKVEKGNSGGAAVSLKNDCYLGTPTFSRTGEIESLARILDVKVLNK
ncbi:MAG: trypsin-like peptidase domain-containing protein [Patescibacteria group bacterium]|nr:trypsin-like peptidase domain-containing protein [Patescibacteria group bacterium]